MKLIKVSTTSQLADILTKGLHLPQFLACVNGVLGVDKDKGPLSSRGGGSLRLPEVESRRPLRGVFRRLKGKPRPELDIDLYHGHPSPGTRIWARGSGPVVDGSGPMQDFAVGSLTLDASFYSERNRIKQGREE